MDGKVPTHSFAGSTARKGYGFLGRDGGPDVFVHYTSIRSDGYKSFSEGDPVEFDVIGGEK